MSGDAEDFDLNLTDRPGKPIKEGFQDKDGVYPKREYTKTSDVNNLVSFKSNTTRESIGTRTARRKSTDSQTSAKLISEPLSSASPEYPKNDILETSSGHIIEYDDTPGSERVNIQHRTGSKVELLPDGSVHLHSKNKIYEICASDKEVIVRGQVLITIESNADLRIQGDATLQVDGDMNTLVQGDYSLEVQGNKKERIHGNTEESVTGGRLEETRGNTIKRHLSNYKERTVGNHSSEYGGSWLLTAEGEIKHRSYGQFQGSYYGGLVTLNGLNKDGDEGQGQFVSKTIYSDDTHIDNVYVSNDVHVNNNVLVGNNVEVSNNVLSAGKFHGTLEGVAKKSEFADTAGAAPTGTAVPKVPSPSSPSTNEERTDAPRSTEEVVDVTNTSDAFILALDRLPKTDITSRILNTGEVISRSRNASLRNNSKWINDHINQGIILSNIQFSKSPNILREAVKTDISLGKDKIQSIDIKSYKHKVSNRLKITSIPNHMKIKRIAKSSQLSPHFRLSHMLAGDSLCSNLSEQGGLSKTDIISNMQLLSYNILEPLRREFKDVWTISEGFYEILENEKVDKNSFTYKSMQGLGVGIQVPTYSNYHYLEIAEWVMNHLVFENLCISYLDYDPSGINEPTLLITIENGANNKTVSSEFNHVKFSDNLVEIKDD